MRSQIYACACLAAFAGATAAHGATITYIGQQTVGTRSVDLSIATDGTLGTIGLANILRYAVTLRSGASGLTLFANDASDRNSALTLTAPLSATAASLVLPFPTAPISNHEFGIVRSGDYGYYFSAGGGSVFNGAYGLYINFASQQSAAPLTGDLVLGTSGVAAAVPEPATWGMMIGGVGLAAGSLRRRARHAALAG